MAPALSLMVNGRSVLGLIRAEVHSTNCYHSDLFSLTLALGPAPLTSIDYWASINAATIEIAVAGDVASETLLVGVIDATHLDPLRGTVTVEGRDLSARLIDSYQQQDFVNQTASEVVTSIATQHGLSPMVAQTNTIVGRYYSDGYTRLSLGQFSRFRSNWDVVVQLARENGFDAFVQGWTLYFQASQPQSAIPIPLSLTDLSGLSIERANTLVNPPLPRVQSWNAQDMAAYVNSSELDVSTPDTSIPFLFTSANMTPDQVDASAARFADELQRLRTVIRFEMPWTTEISPRSVLLLTGTNSGFDAYYRVDSVERHFCAQAVTAYLNGLPIGGTASVTRIAQSGYAVGADILNLNGILINGQASDLTPPARTVIKAGQITVTPYGG